MRTEKQIDDDITKLEKTIRELDGDRTRNLLELDKAKATREELSFAGVVNGGKAARALEEARFNQRHLELEIEDSTTALAQAGKRLDTLRAERDAARLEVRRQEYKTECEAYINDAAELEKALTAVVAGKKALAARSGKLDRLASEAGFEPGPHRNCQKHARHVTNQRLDLVNYIHKNTKDFFSQPLNEIFKKVLAGGVVPTDESEKLETGTN